MAHADLPGELFASHSIEASVAAALKLMMSGATEEEVARRLTWKDFELFCAELLRAGGYTVRQNLVLSRPRAQIDLVASGPLFIISLDCKHWKRAPSYSALEKIARAQLWRGKLLRTGMKDPRPIVSAILAYSEPRERFVNGVAVVPIRALRNFMETVESYSDLLEMN